MAYTTFQFNCVNILCVLRMCLEPRQAVFPSFIVSETKQTTDGHICSGVFRSLQKKNSAKVMKTSKTSLICMRGWRCIKDEEMPEKSLFTFYISYPLVKPLAFLRVRSCKSRLSGVNSVLVRGLWFNYQTKYPVIH